MFRIRQVAILTKHDFRYNESPGLRAAVDGILYDYCTVRDHEK
jgi:hypothetical protein